MTIDEIQSALRFDMDMQLFDGITGETHSKESLKYGNEMNYIHYCANEEAVELLEELKSIKEIDLSIPQHFTKEQSDWIKTYCIKRNKEFYNQALEDALQKMKELKLDEHCPSGCHCSIEQEMCPYNECNNDVIYILEQLKGDKND